MGMGHCPTVQGSFVVAVLLLLLDLVKYVRVRARVCVGRAHIPPRTYVYDLYMLLLLLLLLLNIRRHATKTCMTGFTATAMRSTEQPPTLR